MSLQLIAAAVLGLIQSMPPGTAGLMPVDFILPAERVVIYPPQGQLRRVSGLPLSADAQAAYDREFVNDTYFSAFALSKSGGYGYATTSNSLGAARDIALQECLGQNTDCLIVAEIVPMGYREPGPGDITVTPEVAGYYTNPASAGPVNGTMAMAISADGAYALVWGYGTQAEADAAAMNDCEDNRVSDLPNLPDMPCVLLPGFQ